MVKAALFVLMSLILAEPGFGKTRKDTYNAPCTDVWAAVKDALKNQAFYTVTAKDNDAMAASYNIVGGVHRRTNSVALAVRGSGCEMQISYTDIAHDDASRFKKRVDGSLARLKSTKPSEPAAPADALTEPPKPADELK